MLRSIGPQACDEPRAESATTVLNACDGAPANIQALTPFRAGWNQRDLERKLGIENSVNLASNENALGCSPAVTRALRTQTELVSRYPDSAGQALKQALHKFYGVDTDRIILGNGSNDVLDLLARTFLRPGTSALHSQYGFAVYPLVARASGAESIEVTAKNFGHDASAMVAAIRSDTRLVFIANPNNPTGTLLEPELVVRVLERVPRHVLVVLDEAYDEFLPAAQRSAAHRYLDKYPNLIVVRTFSKAYGLAGLRVGYAFANPCVCDLVNRVRQPFNVNAPAQAAAVAALSDQDFIKRSAELVRDGMRQVERGLGRLGLEHIPSAGNFLSFRVPHADTIFQHMLQQGVIVQPLVNYGMANHLRVSIGLESQNQRFLSALSAALTVSN